MNHDTHDQRHLYAPIPYELTLRGRIAVGAELPQEGAGHPDEEDSRQAGVDVAYLTPEEVWDA